MAPRGLEERAAFVKMQQQRAEARGVALPRQVEPEPKELGEVLTDLHGKPGQAARGKSETLGSPL